MKKGTTKKEAQKEKKVNWGKGQGAAPNFQELLDEREKQKEDAEEP